MNLNMFLRQSLILADGSIGDKGLVGKIIDFFLKMLLGDDYENNAVSIFGTVLGIVFVIIGIIILIIAGFKMVSNQKDEAKKLGVTGICFVAVGAVALVAVTAYYNAVKKGLG